MCTWSCLYSCTHLSFGSVFHIWEKTWHLSSRTWLTSLNFLPFSCSFPLPGFWNFPDFKWAVVVFFLPYWAPLALLGCILFNYINCVISSPPNRLWNLSVKRLAMFFFTTQVPNLHIWNILKICKRNRIRFLLCVHWNTFNFSWMENNNSVWGSKVYIRI